MISQRDPDIFADALDSILGNPNMRTRAAHSMLRLSVEKYSWRAGAVKTAGVYEMPLRQRGTRVGRNFQMNASHLYRVVRGGCGYIVTPGTEAAALVF